MKLSYLLPLAISLFAAVAAPAAAGPVDVTDVVTGSAGAYTHNFTLTNNIGGANTLYFFGVDLSGTITGTPASWNGTGNQNANWNNSPYGGSSTNYPNTWCCANSGTPSGTTTTGFAVLSAFNPSAIKFFGFAFGGDDSANDGHFNSNGNPGFEGVVGGAVPEPASWALMIAGFGLVGAAARRSRAVVAV